MIKMFDEQDPRVRTMILKLRNKAIIDGKAKWGNKYGGFDPRDTQFGFGDLRLTHFRLTNVTYKGGWYNLAITSTGNDLTWVNTKTTNEDAYILIYGIGDNSPSPCITQIQFNFGAETGNWTDLSQLHGAERAFMFFEEGWVVSPKTSVTIKYSSTTCQAVNTEYLYLIGEVLGLKSYLIAYDNPDTV